MYFITANERKKTHSTCFHEFYKGRWDDEAMVFWSEDSLYLDDDILLDLKLGELFLSVNGNYDPYGVTVITEMMWQKIYSAAENIGGNVLLAINEIAPWAEENFKEHDVFTILGI